MPPHTQSRSAGPGGIGALAFGALAYATFLIALVAFAAFVAGVPGTRTVNSGPVTPVREALLVDLALVAMFGLQHSVMARAGFKRWWTQLISASVERSAYVLTSAVVLLVLVALWRPIPGVVWSAEPGEATVAVQLLFAAGVALVVASTFAIDHGELFGLRRVWRRYRGVPERPDAFRVPALYRVVRHPMQLGTLVVFWATPLMTVGHLVLALAMTAYVLVGIRFEERDLVRTFGADYRRYREHVPMLVPRPWHILRHGASARARIATLLLLGAPVVAVAATGTRRALATGGSSGVPRVAGLHRASVNVGGRTRTYLVRVPSTLSRAPRVVLAFHGAAGDGALMRSLLAPTLERWAGAQGAIVVYPDGVERTWNDCRRGARYAAKLLGVNDVDFARSIVRDLNLALGADTSAVLALGFSNGAQLALRLALEAPDLVGAVVAIGASLPEEDQMDCARGAPPPGDPVSALLIHGEQDPISPAVGGTVRIPSGGTAGEVRPVHATVRHFAALAGYEGAAPRLERSDVERITRLTWAREGRARVSAILVRGGHDIARRTPMTRVPLAGNSPFDAVEAATAFFDASVGGTSKGALHR